MAQVNAGFILEETEEIIVMDFDNPQMHKEEVERFHLLQDELPLGTYYFERRERTPEGWYWWRLSPGRMGKTLQFTFNKLVPEKFRTLVLLLG